MGQTLLMKNYPKNTHNPNRKQKTGRGGAMNSLGEPVQNQGVQYTPEKPELNQSQVDYGSTQFGQGANQIGGTNTSAQLAQLLGAASKTVETVVDAAHKWQKAEDKEIEELRVQEMQDLMRDGVNGKAWVNLTDVEKATAANSVNRRAADSMTLKSSKTPLENKIFETEMQMPGTQYKDMVATYKAKKNAILSDPNIENESKRVDALETLNREWGQLVTDKFGDNRDIMEQAEDTIAGHAVADRSAVETEAVRELTSHKPEIAAEVEKLVAEQMAGGLPPMNDAEFAKAVLEASGYPSVYLEESDGAVLKAFGPVFNKFVEDTRRAAMEGQKQQVKAFTTNQHNGDRASLKDSEYGLGADWTAILVARNSLGLVLDQADTEAAKDVAVMEQFRAEIDNLIMRSTDTEENNRVQAQLIIDGLMEIRGIGGQKLRKRMEAHINPDKVNPLNFDAVENALVKNDIGKLIQIGIDSPVMVLPALRVGLERIALNELPRVMGKVAVDMGLQGPAQGYLESIATNAMLNLAGGGKSYLEEFQLAAERAAAASVAAGRTPALTPEQLDAAAIAIFSDPSSAMWADNMANLNSGYEDQSAMAQRLKDGINKPGGIRLEDDGTLSDPAPEVNALTGLSALQGPPSGRQDYIKQQDLGEVKLPRHLWDSPEMGNFMFGQIEDMMRIPGMATALQEGTPKERADLLHDFFQTRMAIGVSSGDCMPMANKMAKVLKPGSFDGSDPKSVQAWLANSREELLGSTMQLAKEMQMIQFRGGPSILSTGSSDLSEAPPKTPENALHWQVKTLAQKPADYMPMPLAELVNEENIRSPEDLVTFFQGLDLKMTAPEITGGEITEVNPYVVVDTDAVNATKANVFWSVTDNGDEGNGPRLGKNFPIAKPARDTLIRAAAALGETGSDNPITQRVADLLTTLANPTGDSWSELLRMQNYDGTQTDINPREAYLVQMLFGQDKTQISQGRLIALTMLAEGNPGVLQTLVMNSRGYGAGAFNAMVDNLQRDRSGNWVATFGLDGPGGGTFRSSRFTARFSPVGQPGYILPGSSGGSGNALPKATDLSDIEGGHLSNEDPVSDPITSGYFEAGDLGGDPGLVTGSRGGRMSDDQVDDLREQLAKQQGS